MSHKKSELILERWASDLSNRDRSKKNVSNNFEDLFSELWNAGVVFDEAYELVHKAAQMHFPNKSVAKHTYKRLKTFLDKTFDEFVNDWNKSITNNATQAFYAFYPVDGQSVNTKTKKVGSMSVQEYSKQRRYADSFPILDTDQLQKTIESIAAEDGFDFNFEDDDNDE